MIQTSPTLRASTGHIESFKLMSACIEVNRYGILH